MEAGEARRHRDLFFCTTIRKQLEDQHKQLPCVKANCSIYMIKVSKDGEREEGDWSLGVWLKKCVVYVGWGVGINSIMEYRVGYKLVGESTQ
uniref:Uncharacterized protein n=1 Tax=Cucumis melo TaxID=3656 RepID=A0A9I9E7M1_CUCME